jgi:superfamily II DNA helicase RecQ
MEEIDGGAKKRRSKKSSHKGGAMEEMDGGAKKRRSKKSSKKSSRKASKKSSKKSKRGKSGMNPGFAAFQKLKKHIADKLNIPNGVVPAKIAGAALKKVKSDNADMDSVAASNAAMTEFDNHIEKYRKMV